MSDTADFARDVDGDASIFQVVPADGPRFWPLIAIGAAVLYFGFTGVSFILVFTIAGVCFVLGWNDLRPVEHRTPARFRVSPNGIEALGETFRKADIEELTHGAIRRRVALPNRLQIAVGDLDAKRLLHAEHQVE